MKLNNKGFAITSILYGLLIIFALMVGSYLIVLSVKKKNLDNITQSLENDYFGETPEITPVPEPTPTPSEYYTVTITVLGIYEDEAQVLANNNHTFENLTLNGLSRISCDNGDIATISGTSVTITNVTSDTTCNVTN